MSNKKQRADFMSESQRKAMGDTPRTHQECTRILGVARPGKTAKDRANTGGQS